MVSGIESFMEEHAYHLYFGLLALGLIIAVLIRATPASVSRDWQSHEPELIKEFHMAAQDDN